MKNKEILYAKKFNQIIFTCFPDSFRNSEDLPLTQKPSVCSVKLNHENKIEPDSLGIYFLITMFENFVQNLLI